LLRIEDTLSDMTGIAAKILEFSILGEAETGV
jgi:hypothetical protein